MEPRSRVALVCCVLLLGARPGAPDPGPDPRPEARRDARAPVRDPDGPRLRTDAETWIVDVVVAAGLGRKDTTADTETSLAVDPEDPSRITLAAFSGGWGDFAPLWISRDGGTTWRRRRSLPAPPGGKGVAGCPCD